MSPYYHVNNLLGCTDNMDNSLDITKLPLGDLDRCRRFMLYHKSAFTAHYPPTVRDNSATFEGIAYYIPKFKLVIKRRFSNNDQPVYNLT